MFRFRLALVIVISFSFVLALGMTLHWGSQQVARQVAVSQNAYDAFDHYQRLSQEAYRHFKQRLDHLITDRPTTDATLETSRKRLYDAMQGLRNSAVKNPSPDQNQNWPSKSAELERVASFTAFLDASKYRFDEVERLIQQGKRDKATQALAKFSEEEIDGKFQPLIDVAINAEREKARQAREQLEKLVQQSRWIALAAGVTAALFSLLAGVLLLRGVKKPLEALMEGTSEIASGNLNHRIALNSRDEFSYLATQFNQMAQELDHQQEKLRQGRATLEKRVAERTVELRKVNEELRRMDIARREFFADISHELRTPITVIRGEAEVTLRGQERDAEEYREALQRIVELSTQLSTYVNDLLFIARAESTKLQFDWDTVDLTDLIHGAVDDFKVMAAENSMTVSLETQQQPIWVRGDRQRLRQVLYILGDNACRYSECGSQINATLTTSASEAIFSLRDQGIGIPKQDMERIFDRHFRSKNALNSRDDGSGLGLPMARSIIKAHGGRISVDSIENEGSTFTISLPMTGPTSLTHQPARDSHDYSLH